MKQKQYINSCLMMVVAISTFALSGCQSANYGSNPIPMFSKSPLQELLDAPPAHIPMNIGSGYLDKKVSAVDGDGQSTDSNSSNEFALSDRQTRSAQNSSMARNSGSTNTTMKYSENLGTTNDTSNDGIVYRGQSADFGQGSVQDENQSGRVQQATYQYPELQPGQTNGFMSPSIDAGSPNTMNPLVQQIPQAGNAAFPINYADIDIYLSETQTGRINFGGAYNSENGIVGQFTIDERNFDISRLPRRFSDIVDGTAFRGAGQSFRLELVPGNEVQRYMVSFGEPYLFDTAVSLNLSAYMFDRNYNDWDEQRLGGRLALGYRLTHDLSVSTGIRAENVDISNPRVGTSPQLNGVVGDTDLYVGHVSLIRDTRDHPFLATEGSYLSMTYHQAFGEFDYSRGDIDFRTYRLMYERPDTSGRHTVSFGTRLGFSGSQTPVFENYFAGGFSTMRGYDFRGASPTEGGVIVGGEFQWLNSLEYMFPLTADDMVKGVLFCDFGTVEESITINADNFRVAPGFGFRVHMPSAGIGAPLAFDFAFPVASAATDDEKMFSFYLGVLR